MIDLQIKCDPDVLFKITKKEADFVICLPGHLQDVFKKYQILKHQFEQMTNNRMVRHNFLPFDKKLEK